MKIINFNSGKVSFTKKIIGYFISSLLVLFVIFWLIEKNNSILLDSANSVNRTNEVLLQNQRLLNASEELSRSARGYLISGKEEYLESFYTSVLLLPNYYLKLKTLTEDNPLQKKRIILIDSLLKDYKDYNEKLIELRKHKGFEAANELFLAHPGKKRIHKLKTLVEKIDEEERKLLGERKTKNQKNINSASQLLFLLETVIILLLIAGFRIIYKNTIRKNKVEIDLQKSNHFINSIINNSNNPISVRDLSGNYILLNDPYLNYLNLDRNDILGKPYTNLFSKTVADKIKITEEEVVSTKSPVMVEYEILLNDNLHFYKSSFFPLFDNTNNIFAVGSILTDVTESKRNEETLKKSNETLKRLLTKLQNLLDSTLDIICIIDEEGRVSQISSECEKLLGYQAEELIGRKYIEFVHRDDLEKTKKVAESLISGRHIIDFENRYCKKDGQFVPVTWNAMWCKEDKLMYCIAKDATVKQQTLKQLKESEISLINAQKIAKLGSWELDLRSRTIFGSKQFYEIVGLTKEELGGSLENVTSIPHPEDRPSIQKSYETAIQTQQSWDVEYRIIRPDSSIINVHSTGEFVFDENGHPTWFTGTIQDITTRKKMEEEREVVIQELTKSNSDLKQFSFITSHNFRAPLSNIIAILNLLDFAKFAERDKELLEMLKTSSSQLNKTIEDITKILVIRSNINEPIERICLGEVYKSMEKVFSHALIDAGGYVVTDFKVPTLEFNPVYLESILTNLISNAINYRSVDRSLLISISTATNKHGETTLTISDNGRGIDLKRHGDKLFGLYQRFHENTNGHGLGLYIIKSQIVALGGKIEVESEENKGTTFIITFKKASLGNSDLNVKNLVTSKSRG